jgi:DNA-binding response OmpR family regulator
MLHTKSFSWKWVPDDYVTIAFSPRALVDRLRTPMRRRSHVSPENLHVFEGGTADFSKPAL